MTKVLVVMPTYNEIGNLHSMLDRIHLNNPDVDVLVVDDNSPDGTGKSAQERSNQDTWLHVLHQPGKAGLGAAYRAGFAWGLQRNYDVLVEMDADGSHQPEQLPLLLQAIPDADLVLGSRWIKGGSVVNWPLSRKILSLGGNLYTRLMLGISVKDATGGYRAFKAETIRTIHLLDRTTQGYIFQVENTYQAVKRGLIVKEVPIEFVERVVGASKMSNAIVIEALTRVTLWGLRNRILRRPID
jgi:dolichol-phosphate mannosyltransferase